jgi:hypothetical protein
MKRVVGVEEIFNLWETPGASIKVKGKSFLLKKLITTAVVSKGFIAKIDSLGILPFSTEDFSLCISSLQGAHQVAQKMVIELRF